MKYGLMRLLKRMKRGEIQVGETFRIYPSSGLKQFVISSSRGVVKAVCISTINPFTGLACEPYLMQIDYSHKKIEPQFVPEFENSKIEARAWRALTA